MPALLSVQTTTLLPKVSHGDLVRRLRGWGWPGPCPLAAVDQGLAAAVGHLHVEAALEVLAVGHKAAAAQRVAGPVAHRGLGHQV